MSRNYDKNKVNFLTQARNAFDASNKAAKDGDLHAAHEQSTAQLLTSSFVKPQLLRNERDAAASVDYDQIQKIYEQNDSLDRLSFFKNVNAFIKANGQGAGGEEPGGLPQMLLNRNYMPLYTDIHDLRKKMVSGNLSYGMLESLRRKDFLYTYFQKTKRNLTQILDAKSNPVGEFNRALLVRSTNNPIAPQLMDATFSAYKTIGVLFGKFKGEENLPQRSGRLYLDFNNFNLPKTKSELLEDIVRQNRYTDDMGSPSLSTRLPTRNRELIPIPEEEEEEESEEEVTDEDEKLTEEEEEKEENRAVNNELTLDQQAGQEMVQEDKDAEKEKEEPLQPMDTSEDQPRGISSSEPSEEELVKASVMYFKEFTREDIESIIENLKTFYSLPENRNMNGEFFLDFNDHYQSQCRDFLLWLSAPGTQLKYQYRMLDLRAAAKLHFVDSKKSIVTDENLATLFANVCNIKWKVIDATNHFVSRAEDYLAMGERGEDVVRDVFYNEESRITRATMPVGRFLVGKFNTENANKIYLRDPTTVSDDVALKTDISKLYSQGNLGAMLIALYEKCAKPLITDERSGDLAPMQLWGTNNSGDKNAFITKCQKLLQIMYDVPHLLFNLFDANFIKRHLQYKIDSKRNIMDVLDVDDPTNRNETQYQGIINWWNAAVMEPYTSLKDSGDKLMFLSAVSLFLDKNLDVFGLLASRRNQFNKVFDAFRVKQSLFQKKYFGDYYYSFFTDRLFLMAKNNNLFSDELSYAFLGMAFMPVILFTTVYLAQVDELRVVKQSYAALIALIQTTLDAVAAIADGHEDEEKGVLKVGMAAGEVKLAFAELKRYVRERNYVETKNQGQQYVYNHESKSTSTDASSPELSEAVTQTDEEPPKTSMETDEVSGKSLSDASTQAERTGMLSVATQIANYFSSPILKKKPPLVSADTQTDRDDDDDDNDNNNDGPGAPALKKPAFKNFGSQFNPFLVSTETDPRRSSTVSKSTETKKKRLVESAVQTKLNKSFDVATQKSESFSNRFDVSYDAREVEKRKKLEAQLRQELTAELERERAVIANSFETRISAIQNQFMAERQKLLAEINPQPMEIETLKIRPVLNKVINAPTGFPPVDQNKPPPKLLSTAATQVAMPSTEAQAAERHIAALQQEQIRQIETIKFLQDQNLVAKEEAASYRRRMAKLERDFDDMAEEYNRQLALSDRAGIKNGELIGKLNRALNNKQEQLEMARDALATAEQESEQERRMNENQIQQLLESGLKKEVEIANATGKAVRSSGTQTESSKLLPPPAIEDTPEAVKKYKEKLKLMQVEVVESKENPATVAAEALDQGQKVTKAQIDHYMPLAPPSDPYDKVGQFLYANKRTIRARTGMSLKTYQDIGSRGNTVVLSSKAGSSVPVKVSQKAVKLILNDNPIAMSMVVKEINSALKKNKLKNIAAKRMTPATILGNKNDEEISTLLKGNNVTIPRQNYTDLIRTRDQMNRLFPRGVKPLSVLDGAPAKAPPAKSRQILSKKVGIKRKNPASREKNTKKTKTVAPPSDMASIGKGAMKKKDLLKYGKVILSDSDKQAISQAYKTNASVKAQ